MNFAKLDNLNENEIDSLIEIITENDNLIFSTDIKDNLKNTYQWFNEDNSGVFALHIENNMLSDMDISEEIQQNKNLDNSHIIFAEHL